MEILNKEAYDLLEDFKGPKYLKGVDCLHLLGKHAVPLGKRFSLVAINKGQHWAHPIIEKALGSMSEAGMVMAGDIIESADPNAPVEDVFRICDALKSQKPEVIISIGGGSSIDATKAAVSYLLFSDIHPDLNDYFGTGTVTGMIGSTGRKLLPVIAVQVSSSSAAHLTKYSNITDMTTQQKMLVVDDAIVPPRALFDYSTSVSQPVSLTLDGGLDGISHCLEVYMGCPANILEKAEKICLTGMDLIIKNLHNAIKNPGDLGARESIGLGTDLGGYAIMTGGTSGAHLNSFSMVDILSHGRAVALMNPYYVVFFSTAIEGRLKKIAEIYKTAGLMKKEYSGLKGRDLGLAVGEAMINFSLKTGFPTTLKEVPGFTEGHIEKCLSAAKNPKLESKLKNMPVPLTSAMVDEYMEPVLMAAKTGDLNLIKNLT